jgi:hypothetical protein
MYKFGKFTVIAAALVCSLPAVASAATLYDCTMKKANWIAPRVLIIHDETTDEVTVLDGVIKSLTGKEALPARVSVKNNKRITFVWQIAESTNSHGQFVPKFEYRGTYLRSRKELILTGKPVGYASDYRGQGACTLEQIK